MNIASTGSKEKLLPDIWLAKLLHLLLFFMDFEHHTYLKKDFNSVS
jgi:hypothetical protein